jgi:hypothetical protein
MGSPDDLNGLASRCQSLQARGERLRYEIAFVLGRLAGTEEELAKSFDRRAQTAEARRAELTRLAQAARENAEALRWKQAEILNSSHQLDEN